MRNIRDSLAKMADGLLPVIDTEVGLADLERGLARLESRQVFGKIVVGSNRRARKALPWPAFRPRGRRVRPYRPTMGLRPRQPEAGPDLDSDDAERIALRLRDDGRPALVFAAHLANWELAAVGAHSYGVDSDGALSAAESARGGRPDQPNCAPACMGTLVHTSLDAPAKLADALERGSHVAMLVDQYNVQGVPVTFFGRPPRRTR
jgi:hypothetical protein